MFVPVIDVVVEVGDVWRVVWCVGLVVGVVFVGWWVFVIGSRVRVPFGRVVLSVGDVLVGEFVRVPVALVCESAVFVVPTIPGKTELSSECNGLAMSLGRAEKRMSRALVVVGLGELLPLAATETEVVRAPPAEEAAVAEETASVATAEVTWLYTELNILSTLSSDPPALAVAAAACLAMMSGKAMLSFCRLSTALRDPDFTFPATAKDCAACARESRSSWTLGEVREDRLGEAVANADAPGIDCKLASLTEYTTFEE